ncbi:hypothetical protein B7463_g10727, partial [Scytalidium lignicola]
MRLLPTTFITPIAILLISIATTANANPEPQVAQGGGAAPAVPAPTQYPVVSVVPSLTTNPAGVVSTIYITFTQTFAATALGSWPLGPTPLAGKIGL